MTGQTPTQNPTDAALLAALNAGIDSGDFQVFDPETTTPDDLDTPARDSDDAERALTQALAHVRAARRILCRSGMRDVDVVAASGSLRAATNRLWAAHPSLNPTR